MMLEAITISEKLLEQKQQDCEYDPELYEKQQVQITEEAIQ